MPANLPPRPRQVSTRPRQIGARRNFAIVASQYNPEYVQGLVDHATRQLYAISPQCQVDLYQVPGAFEIPLAVQEVAQKGGLDAIIALGVIIKGQTDHADHIARAATDALQQIALQTRTPIINEILTVQDSDQAKRRCLGEEFNRGDEAAHAAAYMAETLGRIRNA